MPQEGSDKRTISIDDQRYESERETPSIDLWYPRNDDNAKSILIGLMDVRAADSLLVSYDFERDGWSIKQATKFEWFGDEKECDDEWVEVAFIKAWGSFDPAKNPNLAKDFEK